MNRKRVVVVAPGRGTYTRETTGYLKSGNSSLKNHISWMDNRRKEQGLKTLSELDNELFKAKSHMVGENASSLIYACSLSDFFTIDQNKYEIVAITGNSMGWYTALSLSSALEIKNGFDLVQKMGSMMKDDIIGGQIIYPMINEKWNLDVNKRKNIIENIEQCGAYISIILGGYLVIGGNQDSLDKLLNILPKEDKFPFQIPYHAAFHTPLMKDVSKKAFKKISKSIFNKPSIPLIDGRGYIWTPFSTNTKDLMDYTLREQVLSSYNFTASIKVALKEFCPDNIVLLGPGNSLGGAIGQIMIENYWLSIGSKIDFVEKQKEDPFLISMGEESQRRLVC